MYMWGKKKVNPPPIHDPNEAPGVEETSRVLSLAAVFPLVPPYTILRCLRESGGSSDLASEKLLSIQATLEKEQELERQLLSQSAPQNPLPVAPATPALSAAPQSASVVLSSSDSDKLEAIKKVQQQVEQLGSVYEQSFSVLESKIRDLQTTCDAQRAEIELLHQQLKEKDAELERVRAEAKRPPASEVADEVMKDVFQRFEAAYISAFDEGKEGDELVRAFGKMLRRKLALEMLKGTGEISEKDFVKLEAEPLPGPQQQPVPPVHHRPGLSIYPISQPQFSPGHPFNLQHPNPAPSPQQQPPFMVGYPVPVPHHQHQHQHQQRPVVRVDPWGNQQEHMVYPGVPMMPQQQHHQPQHQGMPDQRK